MQCMMNYQRRSRNKKVNEGLMSDEVKLFEGNQQPRRKRRGC